MRKHKSFTLHLANNLQCNLQIISKNKHGMFQENITAESITQNLTFLTFKEDKIPVTVFINCINAGRQTPPEVGNLHGVSIHHPVVSDSPEPLILETKYTSLTML